MEQEELLKCINQINKIESNISTLFIGKKEEIKKILIGFITGLHVLIEDVPGVGKTTLARCLAASTGLDYARIQFTPDLLPGDIVGMTIWNNQTRQFEFKEGAIMHQFILADEINRASPRTQASLLEGMQEGSVTVDSKTYQLPTPFFVIATQNPTNFIGVFQLPEGELDRFGISITLGYPPPEEEKNILDQETSDLFQKLKPVVVPEDINNLRTLVRSVTISEKLRDFIVAIANKTRKTPLLSLGISPRASQHVMLAAQAQALLNRRIFLIPEDVLYVANIVLRHRIILSPKARMDDLSADYIIEKLLKEVPIPTGLK